MRPRGGPRLPNVNVYLVETADDLPAVLDQFVIYNIRYAPAGLYYSPDGLTLVKLFEDSFGDIPEGSVLGRALGDGTGPVEVLDEEQLSDIVWDDFGNSTDRRFQNNIGYLNWPILGIGAGSVADANRGRVATKTTSGTVSVTIPTDASAPELGGGFVMWFVCTHASGQIDLAPAGGVTLLSLDDGTTGTHSIVGAGGMRLLKISSDFWVCQGVPRYPPVFAGAGADGLVPDPVTENGYFLRDDGSWQPIATPATVFAGYVGADGSTGNRLPMGWSAVKNSTGDYTVTHNLGLTDLTFLSVSLGCVASSGNKNAYMLDTGDGDSFNVQTIDPGTGTLTDEAFMFLAQEN